MRRSVRYEATALLEQDHRYLLELLGQLAGTSTRSKRRRRDLVSKVGNLVRLHAYLQETLFQPAFLEAAATEEDQRLYVKATEDHPLIYQELQELEAADPAGKGFAAHVAALAQLIEQHAAHEERVLLPRARAIMDEAARLALGRSIHDRRMAIWKEGIPVRFAGERTQATDEGWS